MITLHISFRVASLALGQSYDCPSASEGTLKDMDKSHQNFNTTKPNKFVNHIHNSQPPLYNILMAWLHGINFTGSSYHYMWKIPFRRFIIKEKHVTLGIMCHALIHLIFCNFSLAISFFVVICIILLCASSAKTWTQYLFRENTTNQKATMETQLRTFKWYLRFPVLWYTSQLVVKILNNIINVS